MVGGRDEGKDSEREKGGAFLNGFFLSGGFLRRRLFFSRVGVDGSGGEERLREDEERWKVSFHI